VGGNPLTDWSYNPVIDIDLPVGRNIISVEARDPAGNTQSESIVVQVGDDGDNLLLYAGIIGGILIFALIAVFVLTRGRKKPEYHIDYGEIPYEYPENSHPGPYDEPYH
jgi:hypothetical protein